MPNSNLKFRIEKRDYIRKGYFADIVLIDPKQSWVVSPESILYKCHWSRFQRMEFSRYVVSTIDNGQLVFTNNQIQPEIIGKNLLFTPWF